MRVRIDLIAQQVLAIVTILRIDRINVELPHRSYQGFGTIQDVFVDCQPIQRQLIFRITVLVDDFHLLDNGGLAALSRSCIKSANESRVCTDRRREVGVMPYLKEGFCIPCATFSHPRGASRLSGDSSSSFPPLPHPVSFDKHPLCPDNHPYKEEIIEARQQ